MKLAFKKVNPFRALYSRLFFRLASRALLAPIGGSFASARPLYLTGFSPKTTDGHLSPSPNLVAFKPFTSRFSFSSSEVARRAMNVYLAGSSPRYSTSIAPGDTAFSRHELKPMLQRVDGYHDGLTGESANHAGSNHGVRTKGKTRQDRRIHRR